MYYPKLEMEIFKARITKKSIADYLGITPKALNNKLKNRNHFTIDEAKKIQEHFFPEFTLEELFAVEQEKTA